MTSPPIECPTSAIRRTLGGPGGHQVVEQRGQRDAVLGDRQPGVRPQVDRRPGRLRGQPAAVAAAALPAAGGSSASSASPRPCRNTTRSGVALGERRGEAPPVEAARRGRGCRTASVIASSDCCSASRSPIRPLTAETTQPAAAASPRCGRRSPRRSAARSPRLVAAQAGADAGVHRRGQPVVDALRDLAARPVAGRSRP